MGVTKNDSTMKSEADQAQRKNLEVENQQDKNEKNSTAGKKSNGKDTGTYKERLKEITAVLHKHAITRGVSPEKLRPHSHRSRPHLHQAGTDHVHALRHFAQALLRRADEALL